MVEVVDASVAIKWFVDESGRQQALEVLHHVLSKPDKFFVPELFYFELAHVLRKVVTIGPREQHLFEKLLALPLGRMPMNQNIFLAAQKFQDLGLSGYDAAYVAVAQIVGGCWLTFDEKAHAKVAHLGLSKCLGQ
jgi:predicted nucleic acid-binding protein